MTRINCVPPSELSTRHLVAEYRELPRVIKAARRCGDAPRKYVLGTGHVKFFYSRLTYLTFRHHQLVTEMRKRGIMVNYPHPPINTDSALYGDWKPTQAAMKINRARIRERNL